MKNILVALALLVASPFAALAGDQPDGNEGHQDLFAYQCRLEGDISGVQLGFGFSGQVMGGRGNISCVDRRNGELRTVNLPVRLTVIGAGPGFDFSIVRRVHFVSGGVGYVHNPMDLTGQFDLAVSAGGTLIDHGGAITSAVSVKKHAHGLAFELGFMGARAYGLGAHVHGMMLFVNPIRHNRD